MAMANIYNYKKPANYHTIKQAMKPVESVAVSPKQPKSSGDAYLEQKILTARPEELTLMLYDGILKFLRQAKLYIDQNEVEKTSTSLLRAQDIIDELLATLNMDYDVSQNLQSLYVYMRTRMVEANIQKDQSIIDEVLELSTDLRDTWKEAIGIARNTAVQTPAE